MHRLKLEISSYLKTVFGESTRLVLTVFDIVGIIFFLYPSLGQSIGLDESVVRFIGGFIFIGSFVVANFLVYRSLLLKIEKKPGNLGVRWKSSSWNISGSREGIPINPFVCRVYFKLDNAGDEPVVLRDFVVASITTNTDYFDKIPSTAGWYIQSDSPQQNNVKINFPYRFDAHTWNTTIFCALEVNFRIGDRQSFVAQLTELKDYQIRFKYIVETMEDETREQHIDVVDNFDNFRKRTLQTWADEKRYDLLCAALNVDDLIEKI